MGDQARAAPLFPLDRRGDDADEPPIELEIDLGVRQKPGLLPDFGGNGDLPFGGDARGAFSTLYT